MVRPEFAYAFGQALHGDRNNGIEDGALTQLTSPASTIYLPVQPMFSGSGRRGSQACPVPPIFSQKQSLDPSAGAPLTESLLSTGRGDTFTINCSGFEQHGVDPAAFQAAFDRKAFIPVTNYKNPVQVNISFTLSVILEVVSPDQTLQWCNGKQWVS